MSNKTNRDSALVAAVLALDNYLTELERLGNTINSADLNGDVDLDYIQKQMVRFAECAQGIANEVANLGIHLHEAQKRAEAAAQGVAKHAEVFSIRRNEQNEKLEKFRLLGERVQDLNREIARFRPARQLTEEDRAKLKADLPDIEVQLTALIDELHDLKNSARNGRMKDLEKNAGSLAQTLEAARSKLHDL